MAGSKISKIVISKNDESKVIALVRVNGHLETIELGSERSILWLKSQYFQAHKEIASDESCRSVIDILRAGARFGEKIQHEHTYKRIALVNGQIFYDLCSPDWKLVKIERDSITITSHNENLPIFLKSNNQSEQAEPCLCPHGDPLEEFCKLIRMPNNLLFKVHLISMFIDSIPVPIMVISGQQGSIKSTQSGLVKRLIDPSGAKIEDNLSHFPKSIDDLNLHLANNHLVAFDNVSYISDETSDVLCKAITGAGYPKRKYYTDSEEIILKFQRKIILNGITVNIDNGDLAERSIQYYTQKIPSNQRITSEEVENRFKSLLSDVLGQIFLILQKAIQNHSIVKNELKELPRMADFAVWGEAISMALGNKMGVFSQVYKKSMDESNEILNENNPIIGLIDQELGEKAEITIPVGEFYSKLQNFASQTHHDTRNRSFPKSPNKLRASIVRIKPILDEENITIEFVKNSSSGFTKNATLLKIRKQPHHPHQAHLNENSDHQDGIFFDKPFKEQIMPDSISNMKGEPSEHSEHSEHTIPELLDSHVQCYRKHHGIA
ncbi:MAG: hypothetical protein FJ357_06885 [Thaumarchaeota archaeon]|nr:hypothetical protein [Nitrososphaerota archaeon]